MLEMIPAAKKATNEGKNGYAKRLPLIGTRPEESESTNFSYQHLPLRLRDIPSTKGFDMKLSGK